MIILVPVSVLGLHVKLRSCHHTGTYYEIGLFVDPSPFIDAALVTLTLFFYWPAVVLAVTTTYVFSRSVERTGRLTLRRTTVRPSSPSARLYSIATQAAIRILTTTHFAAAKFRCTLTPASR